jgi:hypothetical protein
MRSQLSALNQHAKWETSDCNIKQHSSILCAKAESTSLNKPPDVMRSAAPRNIQQQQKLPARCRGCHKVPTKCCSPGKSGGPGAGL